MNYMMRFSVRDAKNESRSFQIPIVGSMTDDEMEVYASTVWLLMGSLTNGGHPKVSVTSFPDISRYIPADRSPVAISDVEEGAELIFRTAGGFIVRQRIPTVNENIMIPGTDEVDPTNLQVSAWITMMIQGFGGGNHPVSDYRLDDIVEYVGGRAIYG